MARDRIRLAREELAKGDPESDRFAGLHLRMAIEALVYERARSYSKDFSVERFGKWQPKKVMEALMAMDPNADATALIRVGAEKEYGKPPEQMHDLGRERPIKFTEIKKHYDALGSYLHTPTVDQLEKGGADMGKLRNRCEKLLAILDEVMASTVWNAVFTEAATIDCSRCGSTLTKRIDRSVPSRIECFDCGAPYELQIVEDGGARFTELSRTIPCPANGCDAPIKIWEDQVEDGAEWTCEACSSVLRLESVFRLAPKSNPVP